MDVATIRAGEGAFAIEAQVVTMPRGITVTAYSPRYAHVGATAQAIPRPEAGRTATVSLLAVPCHRDEVPAHDIAAALATCFGVPAVASVGFHVDAATKEDIQTFLDTTRELIERIVEHVSLVRRAAWLDDEEVLAVTREGEAIGPVSRAQAHAGEGILHQAFSVFLFDEEGKALLCRRSPSKRLWGGVLAEACAGHPCVGEDVRAAAERRVAEELGARVSLTEAGHIVYREDYGDGTCECERCSVFYGVLTVLLQVNPEEVAEVVRADAAALDAYLEGSPEPLAPWTRLALANPQIRAALPIAR